MRDTKYENGFSLIEVLIAVTLVGLAIVSLVAANGSFTKVNGAAADLSTAEFLIEQIRERVVLIGFNDLDALDGQSFSPPISADGEILNNFAAWSQQVDIERISEANFELPGAPDSSFIRITVKVFLNFKEISSAAWIRAGY